MRRYRGGRLIAQSVNRYFISLEVRMNTLILDHIHKSFARIDAQDVTQALSGINFTVQDGEFLYIVI